MQIADKLWWVQKEKWFKDAMYECERSKVWLERKQEKDNITFVDRSQIDFERKITGKLFPCIKKPSEKEKKLNSWTGAHFQYDTKVRLGYRMNWQKM